MLTPCLLLLYPAYTVPGILSCHCLSRLCMCILQKFAGVPVPKRDRPRIVILGSGWGAISFMKALPSDVSAKYEVVLVSPRNYFLYTPLLPAVATGTMEERSIGESFSCLRSFPLVVTSDNPVVSTSCVRLLACFLGPSAHTSRACAWAPRTISRLLWQRL